MSNSNRFVKMALLVACNESARKGGTIPASFSAFTSSILLLPSSTVLYVFPRTHTVSTVLTDKRPNCLLTTAVKFRADSGTKGSWEIGAMRNGGPKAVPWSPPGTWGCFTHHQGAVGLRRGGGPWLGLWRLDSSK